MNEKPKPTKQEIEQMVEDCYGALITGTRLPKVKQDKYKVMARELGILSTGIGNTLFIEQELLFGLYMKKYVTKKEHKAAVHRAREIILVEDAIHSIQHTHKTELKFFEKTPHKTLVQRAERARPFMSINFSTLSQLTKQIRRLAVPDPKKIDAILGKIEAEQSRLIAVIRSKAAAGIKTDYIHRLQRAHLNVNPSTKAGQIMEKYLRAHQKRKGR